MSVTRIMCPKCGNPMAWCKCQPPYDHPSVYHNPCHGGHSFLWFCNNTNGRIPNGIPCECGAMVSKWIKDSETGEEKLDCVPIMEIKI